METSCIKVKQFFKEGKKVLFSGTPCQIAGLKMFLQNMDTTNLLMVEVISGGVPSPLYLRKYDEYLKKTWKQHSEIGLQKYRKKYFRTWKMGL